MHTPSPFRRLLIFTIVGLVLVKCLTITWRLVAVQQQVTAIQANFQPAGLKAHYGSLLRSLDDLTGEVGFLFPVMRLVPGDVGAVPDLAAAGMEVLTALRPLPDLADSFQAYRASPSPTTWTNVLQAARQIPWPAVQAHLHTALQTAEQLMARPDLSRRFARLAQVLDDGSTLGEAVTGAAGHVLTLLADGADHRFAVIAQNNDEIRATGGFFTALLVVTIHADGTMSSQFLNSYAIDNLEREAKYPSPPAAMYLAMDIPKMLFRDENWSPDFPTTAQRAVRAFAMGQGQNLDALATVNLNVIRLLVDTLGSIRVSGMDQPLNGDDVITQMRHAWNIKPDTIANADAKDFLKPFIEAVTSALMSADNNTRLNLLAAVRTLLARRDIMVYSTQPAVQAILAAHGWAGALQTPPADYLMLVDSNVGYNKVGPNIQQTLDYHVSLANPALPFAQVSITYRNTNPEVSCGQNVSEGVGTYEQRMIACYWDFIRLYTPHDTRLLGHNLPGIPAESLYARRALPGLVSAYPLGDQYTVLEGFSLVPAAQERVVRLVYRLPGTVIQDAPDSKVYRLIVQKQPGAPIGPLRVTVDLPAGAELVSTTPPAMARAGQPASQQVSLQIDRWDQDAAFDVQFRMPPAPQP